MGVSWGLMRASEAFWALRQLVPCQAFRAPLCQLERFSRRVVRLQSEASRCVGLKSVWLRARPSPQFPDGHAPGARQAPSSRALAVGGRRSLE